MKRVHGMAALWLGLSLAACQEGGRSGGYGGGPRGADYEAGDDDGRPGGGDDGGLGGGDGGGDGGLAAGPSADEVLETWPDDVAKEAAMEMIGRYDQPDELTASMLVWHDVGPYAHIVVFREQIRHDFPTPHFDVMQHFVNYDVPPEKLDALARFDGSVMAERTAGTLSARCDREAANVLALNLADQIVSGDMTWRQARYAFGMQIIALRNGEPAPYTEELNFTPSRERLGDPDVPTIAPDGGCGPGDGPCEGGD